ncbi:fibronectin type III domain-containing protein [Nonomuraea dietziae]|uniref:fibronectin type III domain-containing protein n=1 Tax=Nonomuraea dietziae TaxID=65515 RepID=UPI0033F06ABA
MRGDKITALVAGGVVAVLALAAAVFGVGVSSANPKLADVGAWLWTKARGKVVHVNGLSGEVDGYLNDKRGRPMKVVQDGSNVLLVDDSTGFVSRIEPSQLTVSQTRNFGAAGLQLVVSGSTAYAVDPQGSVQRIDPVTLNSVGAPLDLPGPLGSARIDGGGRLWVPVTATGEAVPIRAGVKERAVKAGEAGEELSVTIAGGLPVITNTRAASTVVIGADGGAGEITLPKEVAQAAEGGVLTPASTEGSLVPILTPGRHGLLVVIDTMSNAVLTTKLAVTDAGVPQVLGAKVYVPDQRTGAMIVWDTAAGGDPVRMQVAERPGPIEVFVKDGLLWANDENGDKAVVIDPEGRRHAVDKDDTDVPGPTRTPKPRPTPKTVPSSTAPDLDPDPTENAEEPTRTVEAQPTRSPQSKPTPSETPTPTPTPSRTPTPTPSPTAPGAPGSVSVKSGPGKVDVMFSPSTGGKVEKYTLKASGAGKVTPESVGPEGPFQFEYTSDQCADVSFTVVAHWEGGEVESQSSASGMPCVAPGAPTNFQAKAKNKGADLSWGAPENAAGQGVTYALSGAATNDAIQGTSFSAEGLKNAAKHEFTLKAKNAAGESQTTATTSVDLAYPKKAYQNANNNQTNSKIQCGPQGGCEVGSIPKGQYISITVICQTRGKSVTESETGETTDVWNRIEWNGGTAYISDTLMAIPGSGLAADGLYECEN